MKNIYHKEAKLRFAYTSDVDEKLYRLIDHMILTKFHTQKKTLQLKSKSNYNDSS